MSGDDKKKPGTAGEGSALDRLDFEGLADEEARALEEGDSFAEEIVEPSLPVESETLDQYIADEVNLEPLHTAADIDDDGYVTLDPETVQKQVEEQELLAEIQALVKEPAAGKVSGEKQDVPVVGSDGRLDFHLDDEDQTEEQDDDDAYVDLGEDEDDEYEDDEEYDEDEEYEEDGEEYESSEEQYIEDFSKIIARRRAEDLRREEPEIELEDVNEELEDFEEELSGEHALLDLETEAESYEFTVIDEKQPKVSSAGVINKQFLSRFEVEDPGLTNIGTPEELTLKLEKVGYQCLPFLAAQISLVLNTPHDSVRSILMEGPSGCGKSYMAKCLAKISGAELMCLTCYPGMELKNLIESPSTLAMVNAMAGKEVGTAEDMMNMGILSRAFLKSQEKPVILLIDELDKVDIAIDTFFLGPIQDARIWLESREPIDANIDNLLIIFTKNMERRINDALLRRVHPIMMTYLNSTLERKILKEHCWPQLVDNLVAIADTMRYSDASYRFQRPPAPEELLKVARYVMQMLEWDIVDYSFVGRNIWYMLSKAETDRFVLELMLRYHPDYYDSLNPNGRLITMDQVYAKLGREVLKGIVHDPLDKKRRAVYKVDQIRLTNIGSPKELISKLEEVKYECLDFLAIQVCLILNTPSERVRAVLLEGPSGCGKSYLAKSLAKITGAEYMCLSCYSGMNTGHLIETPSMLGIANAMAGKDTSTKDELINLGVLSRAFLKSQNQPVILLIDEIDKVEVSIDTFFLGPIQDGTIYPESRPPIDCNTDNLLMVFTKNFVRNLNDALLRRLHPIQMTYLNADLERKILNQHCAPKLVDNLISIVDRMRYSGGTYGFDRPPAPEELLTIGHYINKMLEYEIKDFGVIGRNIFSIISKSDHDRAVLEHMMRFHPDFLDPLVPDGRGMKKEDVYAKLGRTILKGIVADPEASRRERAWEEMEYNY